MLCGMKFTLLPREQVAEVLASEPRPPGGLAAKYHVTLTEEERARLEALTQRGRLAAPGWAGPQFPPPLGGRGAALRRARARGGQSGGGRRFSPEPPPAPP